MRCGASYGATLRSTLIRHANLQWPLMALNHVHITDHFFHIQRGSKLFLKCFCDDLHQFHSQSSNYGVSSVQLRRLSFQKAILILDVVPMIPGSYDPQPNANPTHTLKLIAPKTTVITPSRALRLSAGLPMTPLLSSDRRTKQVSQKILV